MGRGGSLGEVLSLSGILKLVESALIVAALVVHRVGDNGNYLFFGSTEQKLEWGGSGKMDLENLGNGVLVTYAIISPVLLICYFLDGRFAIQSLFVESLWNFLGFIFFVSTGIRTVVIWSAAKSLDENAAMTNYRNNYAAGLWLGWLCVVLSLVYFVDFVIAYIARKRIKADQY